jgi:glutathione S-transferase
MELVIGDKRKSSWSMRPWLVLKRTGAPFTETLVRLYGGDFKAKLLAHSPSGLVPVLKADEVVIWDSLAISEHLAERFPQAKLWPSDPLARAVARSASAEMHSGFGALRNECPMDLKLRTVQEPSPAVAENLERLVSMWTELRAAYGSGGDFLFGEWTIADAFYTPVATRIRSYGLNLAARGDTGVAQAYVEALLSAPEFLQWERAGLAENWGDEA